MDRKVQIQVLSITNSEKQVGTFTVLLSELNGERQFSITIGPSEAHAAALYLKGLTTPRPLPYDLYLSSISALGSSLLRAEIYKVEDGVFYSYIYLKKENEIIRIDSRTSDAIALTIRANCPIFIYESILEEELNQLPEQEITFGKRDNAYSDDKDKTKEKKSSIDIFMQFHISALEDQMNQAIKEEDYELAAQIRDRINRMEQDK